MHFTITAVVTCATIAATSASAAAQERAATPAAQHTHSDFGSSAFAAATDYEADFLAANRAAMKKMMDDMTAAPTGDVDRDFVAMMVPHHQGAIDMAQLILRNGKNEQLKRLAQEIIVTQQQEIAAMRLAVGEPLPPSMPSPTQPMSSANPPATPSKDVHPAR